MKKRRLTAEEVLYCREHYVSGDAEFGIRGLAKKMGMSIDAIKDVVHGVSYKSVGGTIHPTTGQRVSREVQEQLAAAYVPNSRTNNLKALAEQFNLSEATVSKYVHLSKPRGRRSKVTEELKEQIRAEYVPYSPTCGRSALAEKYGLSTVTVGNILKDMQKEVRPRGRRPAIVSDEMKEAIIIAHDEDNLSVNGLVERFSLSREIIRSVLKEAGIKLRTRQIVDEETKQEIIRLYAAGHSLRELSEQFNINRATLSKWVEGLNPPKPPKKELDDYTREQIYRFHSRGYGSTIIAKTLGLSQQIVRKVIDGEL